jgi:putative transposase
MPSRTKKVVREVAKLASIPKELVSLFLTGPMTGEAINAARPELVTNQGHGSTAKLVLTGDGTIRIDTPRDRDGSFEPVLVPKHARRFTVPR